MNLKLRIENLWKKSILENWMQKIEGDQDWRLMTEGMNFNVPHNSSFCLEVLKLVNYTCSYFDD